MNIPAHLTQIVESTWFNTFIIGAILFAGVLVGIETYPAMIARYGTTLHLLDSIILGIFVVEILLKMGAQGKKPWLYFKDPWNVFDFVIVGICFIPAAGQYGLVLRLARLFRVLRLVKFIPKLRILVTALLKSIPSMIYVTILLSLLFYMYAVAATFLFSGNDPVHFGNLQLSMLSLFRIVTLEDWTDLMYTAMYGCDVYGYGVMEELCTNPQATPLLGALFFVSFVLIGTMIVLNLFIGVIMSGMDEATAEAHRELILNKLHGPPDLAAELERLNDSLIAVQGQLDKVRMWAADIQAHEASHRPPVTPRATDGSLEG
jgi:voltage-gated sodium channel